MNLIDENKLMRRVQGYHNFRLDGAADILSRAKEASVLDLGCSRGQVGHDFVNNGARILHGCDIDPEAIACARAWFKDFRRVECKHEVVDLSKPGALHATFGTQRYDIVLMVATYHKLKRVMSQKDLTELIKDIGDRTLKWFVWRGTSDKQDENEAEMRSLDRDLEPVGLRRCHTSTLSLQLHLIAVWRRA